MASFSKLSAGQMETLSEIVFGLSITFSAIQFAFNPPSHIGDILGLIIEFAISFTILIWVWITYIRIAQNLGQGMAPPLFLNIALLLLATSEPYLFYTVWLGTFLTANPGPAAQLTVQLASAAWAIDVGLMFVIFAAMARAMAGRGKKVQDGRLARAVRDYSRWFYGCGIALGLTGLPPFWVLVYSVTFGNSDTGVLYPSIHLQLVLWVPVFVAVAFGSLRFGRRIDEALAKAPDAPDRSQESGMASDG